MIILKHEVFDKIKDPYTFFVLTGSIAKRASFDNKQGCFPSIQTICEDTGFSKNRVLKSLRDLESLGLLVIEKTKSSKNEFQSNQYSLTTDLIKVVGDLKIQSGVVHQMNNGSSPNEQPSSPNEQGVVHQKDSNLKSILTSSPVNHIPPNPQGGNEQPKLKRKSPKKSEDTQYPFEAWWESYNKKKGVAVAQKKYNALPEETKKLIAEHTPKYVASIEDKQFQPYPSTYLNQQRWLDEVDEPTHKKPNDEWSILDELDKIDALGLTVLTEEERRERALQMEKEQELLAGLSPLERMKKVMELKQKTN
jgi:hypothetical protein